ncbi:MAG: hypothetical protein ABSG15_15350 [FCB group bacterium]|jgi:hypothetical protein
MHYVIHCLNKSKKETFISITTNDVDIVNPAVSIGQTPLIKHWDLRHDKIAWEPVATFEREKGAIQLVDDLVNFYSNAGFKIVMDSDIK